MANAAMAAKPPSSRPSADEKDMRKRKDRTPGTYAASQAPHAPHAPLAVIERRRGERLSLQSNVLSPWPKPGRGASGISPPNTGADVANEASMVPRIASWS